LRHGLSSFRTVSLTLSPPPLVNVRLFSRPPRLTLAVFPVARILGDFSVRLLVSETTCRADRLSRREWFTESCLLIPPIFTLLIISSYFVEKAHVFVFRFAWSGLFVSFSSYSFFLISLFFFMPKFLVPLDWGRIPFPLCHRSRARTFSKPLLCTYFHPLLPDPPLFAMAFPLLSLHTFPEVLSPFLPSLSTCPPQTHLMLSSRYCCLWFSVFTTTFPKHRDSATPMPDETGFLTFSAHSTIRPLLVPY